MAQERDPRRQRRLRAVIDRLLEKVICSSIAQRPGDIVKELPPEEREILRDAKPEDFNHRGAEWMSNIVDGHLGRKGRFNR